MMPSTTTGVDEPIALGTRFESASPAQDAAIGRVHHAR
jgi:hypothetical protein